MSQSSKFQIIYRKTGMIWNSKKKSRRHTKPVFFGLVTSSRITTRAISKAPEVRSLIDRWFLNISLCTNLCVQSPCTCSLPTPHIYSACQIWGHWESGLMSAVVLFCENSQCLKTAGCFRGGSFIMDIWHDFKCGSAQ